MTNVTLSINDKTYEKMKFFSEIKWSEFVRKIIQERINELESIKSNIYADEDLLGKNWLSEEDNLAWADL